MKAIETGKNLNLLGEFLDSGLENEFVRQDMQKSIRFIKPFIVGLSILNALFLVLDFFYLHNINSLRNVVALRLVFVLFSIIFTIFIKRLKNYILLPSLLTLFEIGAIFIFMFVFYNYKNPDFTIQSLGVITLLIAIFMVPNRWIYMEVASLTVSIGLIIMSERFIFYIQPLEYSVVIVYLSVVIVLLSIIGYRNNLNKRIQYIYGKELLRMSYTDYLTGIYNRSKLDDELKILLNKSRGTGVPLSIVIIDLDDFKYVNDTFGHLAGDCIIVEAVKLIQSNIRDNDIFARWGGEEFVLLLPGIDKCRAVEIAERLRIIIADHSFHGIGKLTCSFGVVQVSSEDNINSLMQKVDNMLYAAKKAGKNTVRS